MMMDRNNNNGYLDEDDYIRDLALAAELGKSLLERNQDLQTNIITLEQIIVEKNREIQLLEKHLNDKKEALSSKLRQLEQIDYQNSELEKQIGIYKSCLDKERLKSKELTDSFQELSIQCESLEIENKKIQQEYKKCQLKRYQEQQFQENFSLNSLKKPLKTSNEIFDKTLLTLKRSKSETGLSILIKNEHNPELNNSNKIKNDDTALDKIFQKWFQSHCHKRLVEYKENLLRLNEENSKLKEDLINKDILFNNLIKSNKTLNIDFEECQKICNELENKLFNYENIIEQFKLQSLVEQHHENLKQQNDLILNSVEIDTNNNNSSSIRRSNSRNKISSLLSATKLNEGMNMYGSFDRINLLNELNLKSNRSLEKELEMLSIRKDAQTQFDENDIVEAVLDNKIEENNTYSSYKDIFRKIYDTLNSSKTI